MPNQPQTTPPNKKTVPLGKPLHLSDKDLDELSQVTPLDIEKAKALWRSSVDPEYRTLLDAQPVDLKQTKKKGTK